MGNYRDVAPMESSATNNEILQDPYKVTNMEEFNLNDVLNRNYVLDNQSWSSAHAVNHVIGNYKFPARLFTQNFIADTLKYFNYFKAGVKFSIRIVSNKFQYGSLMVSYLPTPYAFPDDPRIS